MTKPTPHQPYEYRIREGSEAAPARVIRLVGHNKKVLEVGAGPGSIARRLVSDAQCDVQAVEIDPASVAKLKEFCSKVHEVNLNDPTWTKVLDGAKFDAVIVADVLEHLLDPLGCLKQLASAIAPDGYVIASIPNVGYNGLIACLYLGDFAYSEVGLLDKTHIKFFGAKNVEQMFADAGLKFVEVEAVAVDPANSEFAKRWLALPLDLRSSLQSNPFGSVYQFVVKAAPVGATAQAVSIEACASDQASLNAWKQATKSYQPSLKDRLVRKVRQHLSEAQRDFLRDIAWRLRFKR